MVPFVKLSPGTIQVLQNTSLAHASTILDIIEALIYYNATNPLLNQQILSELQQYQYVIDSTEWGIISYNINACSGWTAL